MTEHTTAGEVSDAMVERACKAYIEEWLRDWSCSHSAMRAALEAALASSPAPPGEAMCPNCLTPWKCNGPHESEDADPPERPEAQEGKCQCNLRTRLLGDGCAACYPELAARYAEDDDNDR